MRKVLCVLVAAVLVCGAEFTLAATQTGVPATAAEAKSFLGEWTLALEGPNGPGTFDLSVKEEDEKVVGEIATATMETQKITDISRTPKGLTLSYWFTYDGNPVDAVVSLTPAEDGQVAARIDFAGGAYTMTGQATPKDKAAAPR
jgi:hypothetical protein